MRRALRPLLILGLLPVLLVVAAAPAGAQDTTAPPATQAPPDPTPATTAPAGGTTDDVGDTGIDAETVIALVVLGLVAIAAIAAVTSRRSRAEPAAAPAPDDLVQRWGRALGEAQWVHDTLVLELANRAGPMADPQRLAAAWTDASRRINDLGAELSRLAGETTDQWRSASLREVARTLALLHNALDTDVHLRRAPAAEAGQDTLLADSAATVSRGRADYGAAVDAAIRR
jgi:hypothetical protein